MEYTRNYNLRKPEDTDPADIQDLNYNADVIDSKLKEIEDWETAHLQASNPHSITPALIGAETPTGAQQKADQAETNAKSYADTVTNNALNSAKDYADDILESANSHTDQVASDLTQKLNETRIKVLDVEQDVSNISKVLTSLNPNQEAKQSVSGYGILSLPKNAANGQVSVSVKGNTETDEEGNTKSTVSAIRLKSVGKNLFDKKLIKSNLVNIDGRQCVLTHDITLPINKFKANTAYTIKYETKKRENLGRLRVVFTYADGTTDAFPIADYADWTTITRTSNQSKSLISITINNAGNGSSNKGYINLDNLQVEEGTVSTPYEPYTESTQYLPNVGELRSLPNGVRDEIRVSNGKAELIKKTKQTGALVGKDVVSSEYIHGTNTYAFISSPTTGYFPDGLAGSNLIGYCQDGDFKGNANVTVDKRGMHLFVNNNRLYTRIEKDKIDSMAGTTLIEKAKAYFDLYPVTLIYQLAEPIVTPINVSGNLISYPSGTVYVENVVADAGIYTDKMTVLHQDLPIKTLEKLSKVDFATGLETELDVSQAVISQDKLFFTHPELSEGDIVFFVYEYDRESTEGETEIEYYDSRYVVQDSVTGKFYKWKIAVADGVPSIELTEV